MAFLQVFLNGRCYLRTPTLRIVGHLVEPLAVVVVLQLSERGHTTVEIVVDDGKAVAVVVERLPAREVKVLRIVGERHAALQHILASHRRTGVEVDAYDEVGIVCEKGNKLVVKSLLVELQLVELRKLKYEFIVTIIINCRSVGRVVHRTRSLNERLAGEEVRALVVLCDSDVELALYALILLELQVIPLPVVDKLLKVLLQILEDTLVSTLYLVVVDGYFGL